MLKAQQDHFIMFLFNQLKELIMMTQLLYGWMEDQAVHPCSDFYNKLGLIIFKMVLNIDKEIILLKIPIHGIKFLTFSLFNHQLELDFLLIIKLIIITLIVILLWIITEQFLTFLTKNSHNIEKIDFGLLDNHMQANIFQI